MEKLTEIWNQLFDQFYVIHFEPNGRRTDVERELERVGILQTGKVIFKSSWDSPLKKQFLDHLLPKCWKKDRPPVKYAFDCAFNHYECISRSLSLKHNRILIFEDDVRFLKDLNKIYTCLKNIPEDADIILFDKIHKDFCRYDSCSEMYVKYDDRIKQNWSASCYALSSNGMKFVCDQQEKIVQPPDEILVRYQEQVNLNRYFIKKNLAVQKYIENEHKWNGEYIPNCHLNKEWYAD